MNKVLEVEELKKNKAPKKEIDSITWDLKFPVTTHPKYKTEWFGNIKEWEEKGYPVDIFRTVTVDWLWNLILESTYNRAEPGILFLDRANDLNELNYAETIYSVNPCLVGETLINTRINNKEQMIDIKTLNELYYNNKDWLFEVKSMNTATNEIEYKKITMAMLTHKSAEVIKITDDCGNSIECTPDHKIWTDNRGYVMAKDLKENDILKID